MLKIRKTLGASLVLELDPDSKEITKAERQVHVLLPALHCSYPLNGNGNGKGVHAKVTHGTS